MVGEEPRVWDGFPNRVASLQPSATVVLERIGMLDRVVACTKWCADVCPSVANTRAVVHDSWSSKADEILAVHPDLVIASVPYREESLREILKAGIPVLALAPKSLTDVHKDIALIAGVMGVPERAAPVISEMQAAIHEVRSRTRGLPRPRVFCEEWGKPIIQSQLWVKELVEAAGGDFIGNPGATVDAEFVIKQKPDVLIAAWCGAGDRVPLEKIVSNRGWRETPAAKAGRIYCVRDEFLNTPAPTLIFGLHALAAAIHPETFAAAAGLRSIAPTAATEELLRPRS
jgi:iron complex transport system substrate-binding protein